MGLYSTDIPKRGSEVSPRPCAVTQGCVSHTRYSQWSGSMRIAECVIVPQSFQSSGTALLLGKEKWLTCYSVLLGLHPIHFGSWSYLIATGCFERQPIRVFWLKGRSSPLMPALAAFTHSASSSHHHLFLHKKLSLFSASLMSVLLWSFHWSSLFQELPHHYFTSSLPLWHTRRYPFWLPFTPFLPQDQTCSICVSSSVLLRGLQLLSL